jgi:hypothetical protein
LEAVRADLDPSLAPKIKRLELGRLALSIERQDIDRSGVGRQDVEEVVIREGRNGVVDRGRPRFKRILIDDRAREVVGDGDLGDDVRPDVGEEEGPGLLRKARPAGRALARNRKHLALRCGPGSECAEVERGEADARVGGEDCVLSGDDGHREGKRPPCAGGLAVKLAEREPSSATSQLATNPGVGGTPLTETSSFFESSLKRMSETVPGGPVGGVVWGSWRERLVFGIAIRPSCSSGLKHWTPLIAPPLTTQVMFFAVEKATAAGNSPPELTGPPTILRLAGLF